MSEDDGEDEMTGRRRGLLHGSSSAALVPPLENDDLLARILLRLPALPSSLLRASAVCKRWHGLVSSDPHFLREFRSHHRSAPLLGFFPLYLTGGRLEFYSMLDPPDQIPSSRFTVTVQAAMGSRLLRCYHGRVLILNQLQKHFLVWDPVTADLRQIAFPAAFGSVHNKIVEVVDGAVVCSSDEQGHVHGACHSDPFKLVLLADDREKYYACVYSSETGAWGDLFSMMRPPRVMMPSATTPSTMFKNSICLLLVGEMFAILEFDWVRQNLALIDIPLARAEAFASIHGQCQFLIAPADSSGAFSFIVLNVSTVRVWKRVSNGDCTSRWILGTAIELGKLLSLKPTVSMVPLMLLGLDEEGNVMMKSTDSEIVFLVNLESLKFKQLPQKLPYIFCHPFSSFYTPGMYLGTGVSLFLELQKCKIDKLEMQGHVDV
ncbi:hypothetical protein U9M48_008311 [Paspalum notatum var. saurae]|uniref:F-box domain-containing protein n=1 Tax=Paspalum notatum var. saurae TaxID=547442 RepID=A0AAQ3SNS9_PASNO